MIKKIKLLIMLLITMQSYKENLNYASVFAILFQIIFRWLSCLFPCSFALAKLNQII